MCVKPTPPQLRLTGTLEPTIYTIGSSNTCKQTTAFRASDANHPNPTSAAYITRTTSAQRSSSAANTSSTDTDTS